MSDVTKVLGRLIEVQKELDARKKLYEEYDELVKTLVEAGFKSGAYDDLVLELKDKFAEKNTGWTMAAVKRYEVEIITKELAAKRALKASKGA